ITMTPTSLLRQQRLSARLQDRIRVNVVLAIKIGDVAALAEVIRPERHYALAAHRAEPAMCRRMTIQHRHQSGVSRQRRQHTLDMRHGGSLAVASGTQGSD